MGERSPCSLAALGVVNCLGRDASEIWPRVLAGDQSGFSARDDFVPDRSLFVGAVSAALPEIPSELARYACRNNALTLLALEQVRAALDDARTRFGADRIGVVLGTSTSGVGDAEAAIAHQIDSGSLSPTFHYDQLEFGGAAGFVADRLDVGGPAYALSTACSSGARALATARSWIRLGVCDAVVAGATDSLCGLTTAGFSALQAISDEITNPMSRNRKGLTLGEGAAVFLVTGDPGGIQLLGVGESSEAHHMSAPDPEGAGARRAMERALEDGDLRAEDVAYLNLHGTGTPLNDSMESAAVAAVFPSGVPCSSTKALVGHTLGAAGAMEAAFCWLLLANRGPGGLALPPHCWDGAPDDALPRLALTAKGEVAPVAGPARAMSNSFGFGGNNCTLVLGDSGT